VQQTVAQLPWGSNLTLLEKLSDPSERLWYANQAMENGWSRNILVHQIESGLFRRQGKAVNNFALTLPPPGSDMAAQIFKDPYLFDFLGTADPRREREVEEKDIPPENTVREPGARYGFENIAIVDAPFDATDGADTPFGKRYGGDVFTLTEQQLQALKQGKTLALDVQNEYITFLTQQP
jgi:predicted nuclease of restriction endonuclease-like (RecB) superfamily